MKYPRALWGASLYVYWIADLGAWRSRRLAALLCLSTFIPSANGAHETPGAAFCPAGDLSKQCWWIAKREASFSRGYGLPRNIPTLFDNTDHEKLINVGGQSRCCQLEKCQASHYIKLDCERDKVKHQVYYLRLLLENNARRLL